MSAAVQIAVLLVFAFCAAGALCGIAIPEKRIPALLAWAGSLASGAALYAAGSVLTFGVDVRRQLWTISGLGEVTMSLDRLAALFLLLAAVVVLASSVFSAAYLKRYLGHYSLRAFNAWYLLLIASIVWILVDDDILGFLLAWEGMSITSYLLVNFEHRRRGVSRAGYLMLAMGEAGFIAVAVVLLYLSTATGAPGFSAMRGSTATLGTLARWAVFLISFLGFGVKAGLTPVNSWLPRAHPAAPANVSAILSGVILNLGIYGIVRVDFDVLPLSAIGMGIIVLLVGTASALVGILYATTESDLKALLAHSSIENMGIVVVGLGAGAVFASYGLTVFAGMAFLAAFYHLINHSLYKSLLFLGAGAVDEHAGTRDLDRLGGLIHVMPYTAAVFLAGSLSISGLPPFNGYVSEWLTLQTLLRSAEIPSTAVRVVFALCGAALALTAALAVTCFVKAFAIGFLGKSREPRAATGRDAHGLEIVPMALLAFACLLLGLLPTYVIPSLGTILQPTVPPGASSALVPPFFSSSPGHLQLPAAFVADFHNLGAQTGQRFLPGPGLVLLHRGGATNPVVFATAPFYACIAIAAFLLCAWLLVRVGTRRLKAARREVWAGGIPRLFPQMVYTATGFSNPVRVIFQAVFRPVTIEDTRQTVAVHFRTAIRRRRQDIYLADSLVFDPLGHAVMWLAGKCAAMHHGRLNAYVAYSLGFLVVVLVLFRIS